MDDKTKNTGKPFESESHSAFPRRDKTASSGDNTEVSIPSQPRSFSPVRPQRSAAPRKPLSSAPAAGDSAAAPAAAGKPADADKPASGISSFKVSSSANTGEKPTSGLSDTQVNPAVSVPPVKATTSSILPDKGSSKIETKPGADAKSTSSFPARATSGPTAANAASAKLSKAAGDPAQTAASEVPAATAIAAGGSVATPPKGTASHPQSSGAGGDTIRLRVSPRTHARALNTSPGRGIRRRLPDIRQGRSAAASSNNYGPFSLLFGFLWLIFKMVFFTALVLGLGALIGFMVMTEYIKTPETTVPNVSGMKVDEAFEVLSDKSLGVIKLRTESSALVAPGEIVSQQPPAGAKAKENTDVGVVISSGRSQFVVPDVVGETRENAVNKIRGARLEVGNILPLEDNSVPAGNVISQTPSGKEGFDEAVKVDLMISAGPPGKSLNMPDLTGLTVLEAKAALQAVGIETVITVPEDAEPTAKVKSQSPLVSKTVFQTDKVTLSTESE